MTHEELMAAANDPTGLEDFGDDSFREGLEILARSLDQEARLNATGEAVLYPSLVGHLSHRLQIEDWYRRHPEIDEVGSGTAVRAGPAPHRLDRPVVSAGPGPRGAVPAPVGVPAPCPPPSTVTVPTRAARPRGGGSKSHVPTDVNGPMECLDLMALDFRTHIYLAFA